MANTFEDIRHEENGMEFWLARELGPVLGYTTWQRFTGPITRAIEACKNSGQNPSDHFSKTAKMIPIGKGGERPIEDYKLSRYACYLIVQNGDPAKPIIALGQTYFALQTRRQELEQDSDFLQMSEDGKRLALRSEMKEHNKALVEAAKDAGVATNLDYAIFQDHGYRGLYGGLSAKGIHDRKGLKKSQKILDHMGSTELAANLFRATQTEEKLRREKISTKSEANKTHFEVGKKVRQTIKELGGTMPEDLPTPEKSIQQLERAQKKALKD
jgi:DNA-damage-inducible protein D